MRPATIVIAFSILTVSSTPAFAYLDPGTGSMILQGIIGGVAAGIAVISLYYRRAKEYLNKRFGRNKEARAQGDDSSC